MRTGISASIRRKARTCAYHGCDEGVKRENRRSGKTRKHRKRLAADHGQAEGLSRFESDAMDQDSRGAELCNHAVGEVAGSLGSAAGEDDEVAGCERAAQCTLDLRLVVSERRKGDRLAAGFGHR